MQLLGQECLGAGWGSAARFRPKATVGEEVSCDPGKLGAQQR